jgi:hypothetical protein
VSVCDAVRSLSRNLGSVSFEESHVLGSTFSFIIKPLMEVLVYDERCKL